MMKSHYQEFIRKWIFCCFESQDRSCCRWFESCSSNTSLSVLIWSLHYVKTVNKQSEICQFVGILGQVQVTMDQFSVKETLMRKISS